MESARFAALLVTSINTNRMGHRVSRGNQQIVNWDSGRTVAFPEVSAGKGPRQRVSRGAKLARTRASLHADLTSSQSNNAIEVEELARVNRGRIRRAWQPRVGRAPPGPAASANFTAKRPEAADNNRT